MRGTIVFGLTCLTVVVSGAAFASMTTNSGVGRRKTNGFVLLCRVAGGYLE